MERNKTTTFPYWMIAALVLALLFLLGSGLWFYHTEKSAGRQRAEKQLTAAAHLKVSQISTWRDELLDDAALLTENAVWTKKLAGFLADSKGVKVEELLNYLRSIQRHNRYTDILVVDPKGQVRLSLGGNTASREGYAIALAEALRTHKPVFTDLYAETQYPAPHISVVAPIFNGEGQTAPPFGAVILISDAAQVLYPLLHSWPTPSETTETLLVRRDGDTVLFLNDLLYRPESALKLRISLSQTDTIGVMAVLGREGFVEGHDYQGVPSLAVILPVPGFPWFLVTKDDTTVVLGVWRFRAALLLILFAVFLGGLGVLGLVAWQNTQKSYYLELYGTEVKLRASVERHSITLKAIGDGIIATDAEGRVELLNPVAETLTGWSHEEASGRPLEEIFEIINEETLEKSENPVTKVLREGHVVGMANHTLLIAKNGIKRAIADSAAPIRDDQGNIFGVVLAFRDQTDERRTHRLLQARFVLQEYAFAHTLDELLTKALDEIGVLVDSPVGFYHIVEADGKTLILQQWSTRTLQEFCQIEGRGRHYSLEQAGVWADCVRERRPIVHNDYAALPNKKGMPEGHAPVVRELVVPVMRAGKVVAVLGMGNKPEKYTENDIETVSYLSDVTWRLVEQKMAEENVLASERRYRTLYQSMMDAFVVTDLHGRIKECNAAYSSMLGYSNEELRTLSTLDITPPHWLESEKKIVREQLLHFGCSNLYEKEYRRKDGTIFPVELRTFLILNNDGKPEGLSAVVRDISERKRTEEEREKLQAQLNQAQKMESVGRLAGGVAHDFNNMLSVILGYTELALNKIGASEPLHRDLQTIFNAAKRSADITRQLLAFARKQTIAPKVLDLNDTVEGMLKMLRRLIGEDIDLAWLPGTGLWPVRMDPSQMDQLLANLCVNACDAISGVGRITIETDMVAFNKDYCADHVGFVPGDFVLMAISDDGCGMEKAILDKIFEPFFTTKEEGKGTGLGLATVYGIVKQNNGFINVYSEPGQGTTFKVYLPRHQGEVEEFHPEDVAEKIMGHGETVLVVEDEIAILELSRVILEELGYNVLTAGMPSEALRLAETHVGEIKLLITDVIMPEMNGRGLAEQLHTLYPGLKTLFMSGYTANVIAHRGVLDEGVHFIEKPFSTQDLAAKVREVLSRKEQGGRAQDAPKKNRIWPEAGKQLLH